MLVAVLGCCIAILGLVVSLFIIGGSKRIATEIYPTIFDVGFEDTYHKHTVRRLTVWDTSEEVLTPDISTLGVYYDKLYEHNTNIFIHNSEPSTKWEFGNKDIQAYIQSKYMEIQRTPDYKKSVLVYQRKGPRGMATQMLGACDAVLLGILNDRPSKINAPGLPAHFFSYPFPNFTYPIHYPTKSELFKVNQLVDISTELKDHIDFSSKAIIPGISAPELFQDQFTGSVAIDLPVPVTKQILKRKENKVWIKKNIEKTLKLTPADWYASCVPSLFQLSDFSKQFVKPYLDMIQNRYTVGIHYRLVVDDPEVELQTTDSIQNKLANQFYAIDEKVSLHNSLIVLATDSDIVSGIIKQKYGSRVISPDYLPFNTTDGQMNEASLMRNLIELQLLGECDALFLTTKSKFSMVALALNKKSAPVEYF